MGSRPNDVAGSANGTVRTRVAAATGAIASGLLVAALVAGTAIPWVGRAAGSPDRGRRPRLGDAARADH